MTLVDWLTLIALIAGPLLAVQITQILDRTREKQNRKIAIFQTLMITRATTLASDHIRALNAIELEFHSGKKDDHRVVEAWRAYLAHLNTQQYEGWPAKRLELFTELLHVLASVLGYRLDKSSLRVPSYYPVAAGDLESDQYLIRKATLDLLEGKTALQVSPVGHLDNQEPPLPAQTSVPAMVR